MGRDGVLYSHWAVLDLVALDYPFKVLDRWVSEGSIQSSCELCTFQLSFAECFLVIINCVDEGKVFVGWFVVVKSAGVHLELHVGQVGTCSVDDEHLVVTVIRNLILLYQVPERYDIGYCELAEPNLFVISVDGGFMANLHCATITL